MRLRDDSRVVSETCHPQFSRLLPKIPGFIGVFFLFFLAASLAFGDAPVAAQTAAPPAAQQTAPATATTPAVPAPDSVTPDAKPGDPAPMAQAPTSNETMPNESLHGTGSAMLPHDLSPYGMFMHADIIVKVVMVGLAFASLVTWTVLLMKTLELFAARANARRALADLAEAGTLEEAASRLTKPQAPVTRLTRAALAEAERSQGLPAEGVKERATALLARIEARAGRAMQRGTGLLATIGSTAPFVGLFGTVWGIMNSFIGISKTNTTNLAVVAPGIAEALLATASGLVAAIPAVIIYNMFARGITGYRSILGDASTEVLRLLSRDLDRQANGDVDMRRRAAE